MSVKVSVVMSVYAEPVEWIEEAISSILNQTFNDFEFILVNDNPKREDNIKLLNSYKSIDSRVVIVENDENIGLTKSLNKAIEISKGKYIARMDADDISLPTRFEKQVEFLEKNRSYIVCGTDIQFFGENKLSFPSGMIRFRDKEIKAQLIRNTCFAHPTVMFRKQLLLEKGIRYDEDFIQAQDYKLWCDLSDFGKYQNINEVLLNYRVNSQQVSKKSGKLQNKNGNEIRKRHMSKFLSLETIKELSSEDANIKTLFKVKKELKEKSIPRLFADNVLFVSYLSIKNKTIIILLYYFFSLDFLKYISNVSDVLRVVESSLFPNRKPKRIQ
ncbi:hypothetical protein ACIVBQ_000808 [Tenacibaculum discolor]